MYEYRYSYTIYACVCVYIQLLRMYVCIYGLEQYNNVISHILSCLEFDWHVLMKISNKKDTTTHIKDYNKT